MRGMAIRRAVQLSACLLCPCWILLSLSIVHSPLSTTVHGRYLKTSPLQIRKTQLSPSLADSTKLGDSPPHLTSSVSLARVLRDISISLFTHNSIRISFRSTVGSRTHRVCCIWPSWISCAPPLPPLPLLCSASVVFYIRKFIWNSHISFSTLCALHNWLLCMCVWSVAQQESEQHISLADRKR